MHPSIFLRHIITDMKTDNITNKILKTYYFMYDLRILYICTIYLGHIHSDSLLQFSPGSPNFMSLPSLFFLSVSLTIH